MEITNVQIWPAASGTSPLVATATITIDGCFVVHNISLIKRDGEYIINMPSKRNRAGDRIYNVAHPINRETRDLLTNTIVAEYMKIIANLPAEVADVIGEQPEATGGQNE